MKSIIHKAIYWALPLLTLPTTGLLLQSCEEDKAEKWVDLRYRVEDSYVIQASNPEPSKSSLLTHGKSSENMTGIPFHPQRVKLVRPIL